MKPTKEVIKVWLNLSNEPVIHEKAQDYQKGDLLCVFEVERGKVFKYPIDDIWRVEEDYPAEQQAHPGSKKSTVTVKVHLKLSNEPVIHEKAQDYQKGDLLCVFEVERGKVFKYPISHIWRVEENYPLEQQAHPSASKTGEKKK